MTENMISLLLTVTSVVIRVAVGQYGECNPLVCLHYFDKLFIHEDARSSCLKVGKLENCLSSCLKSQVDMDFFVENFALMRDKICTDEAAGTIDGFFGDTCVAERKFQMLGCLQNASTLFSYDHDETLTTCRKILEADNCPQEYLTTCGDNLASYAISLITRFLKSLRGDSCNGYDQSLVWNLVINWKYSGLSAFVKCLDDQNEKLLSCMPEKATTNIIHSRHGKTTLCNGHEKFVSCANNVVLNHCGHEASSYFTKVIKVWYDSLVPYCFSMTIPPSLPLQKTGILTSTERADVPLEEQKNNTAVGQNLASDVIIVHFWSMDNSAANGSHLLWCYLTVLAVILNGL